MGAEMFEMSWVQSIVLFFSYLAWILYAVGFVVACAECGLEYSSGRADVKGTAMNLIKGFMAVSLFSVVPVKLYELCVSLQANFGYAISGAGASFGTVAGPHTVLQELIKKIEGSYGQFSSRVRMLNVQGGVEVPISDFDATFTWSGTDGADKEHGVSEDQKVDGATGSVVFSYHIGEIRIAQSLLQSILSVEVFEKELINALLTAYLKARDIAVLKGTGNAQPTGILTDVAAGLKRIPASNIIEFTEEEIADWTAWEKKLFANIPLGMEGANPEFAMAKQTYVGNLCTLKDANNQPINKAGFDASDKQYKFNEYPVLRTEQDLFKSFDLCANGEYFGM